MERSLEHGGAKNLRSSPGVKSHYEDSGLPGLREQAGSRMTSSMPSRRAARALLSVTALAHTASAPQPPPSVEPLSADSRRRSRSGSTSAPLPSA